MNEGKTADEGVTEIVEGAKERKATGDGVARDTACAGDADVYLRAQTTLNELEAAWTQLRDDREVVAARAATTRVEWHKDPVVREENRNADAIAIDDLRACATAVREKLIEQECVVVQERREREYLQEENRRLRERLHGQASGASSGTGVNAGSGHIPDHLLLAEEREDLSEFIRELCTTVREEQKALCYDVDGVQKMQQKLEEEKQQLQDRFATVSAENQSVVAQLAQTEASGRVWHTRLQESRAEHSDTRERLASAMVSLKAEQARTRQLTKARANDKSVMEQLRTNAAEWERAATEARLEARDASNRLSAALSALHRVDQDNQALHDQLERVPESHRPAPPAYTTPVAAESRPAVAVATPKGPNGLRQKLTSAGEESASNATNRDAGVRDDVDHCAEENENEGGFVVGADASEGAAAAPRPCPGRIPALKKLKAEPSSQMSATDPSKCCACDGALANIFIPCQICGRRWHLHCAAAVKSARHQGARYECGQPDCQART